MTEKKTAAVTRRGADNAVTSGTPAQLLEMAISKDLDVDKLERLMEMQERWEARQARREFFEALAKFQQIIPAIIKWAEVDYKPQRGGRVYYRFAALDSIIKQIKEPLQQCGLTYRYEYDTSHAERGIAVTCVVTHLGGHSERTKMRAPADESGSKNIIQALGSSVKYLQRYTLLGALGIVTEEEDNDGRSADRQKAAASGEFADMVAVWVWKCVGSGSPLFGEKLSEEDFAALRKWIAAETKGNAPQSAEDAMEWLKANAEPVPQEDETGGIVGVTFQRKSQEQATATEEELPL